ncbi:hypothetical protein RHMOL_Rhmol05G0079300 [Rhododendron molle]|uniref:Uncharacterized protein n=1 Tax=Rhododendron molle TaxID=49168 RepID=A0ACC0NLV2_RHOML|nr:hypothetical protein RHMOL_Rhmol05G0079300 [Rhododendron molle]
MSAPASYLARRAAQKERVRILYRRALKETLNWAVHRHLFYRDASELREKFDANKNVESLETIDRLLEDGEAAYNKWRHPDPYIVPWAPGGSKFTRNPPPPPGAFLSYFSLSKCPVKGSEKVVTTFQISMDMTDKGGFLMHRVCVVFNDALNVLRRLVVLYLFLFETDSLP